MAWLVGYKGCSLAVSDHGDVFTIRRDGNESEIRFSRKKDAELMLRAFQSQAPKMAMRCFVKKRPVETGEKS